MDPERYPHVTQEEDIRCNCQASKPVDEKHHLERDPQRHPRHRLHLSETEGIEHFGSRAHFGVPFCWRVGPLAPKSIV